MSDMQEIPWKALTDKRLGRGELALLAYIHRNASNGVLVMQSGEARLVMGLGNSSVFSKKARNLAECGYVRHKVERGVCGGHTFALEGEA